jgi:MFS family permease
MLDRIKTLYSSLTIRNYRLFFMGQGVSLIGTWIQRTTMGWFVYRITGSAFLLGLVSFLSMIPSVFVSPFAGAWADKWNRHHTMIATQIAFFLQTSVLAILVLSGVINSKVQYPLLILALLQGVIEAIDAPIRQSFVIDLVQKRSLLPNAIATNSAMFNGARLIGPAVGGFLIILFSEGVCFAINAISYLPVIVSLFFIKISYPPKVQDTETTIKKIGDGLKYAWANSPIRFLIMNLAVYTIFAMSYTTLLPIFAKDVLKGTSGTQGLLMSTAGIGALIGSVIMASRTNIKGMPHRLVFSCIAFTGTLFLFSFSRSIALSLLLMIVLGFFGMQIMASTNTLIQSVVDDKMRGRVISLYTMAFNSMAPFGSLLMGSMSSKIGAPHALLISSVIFLIWSMNGLRLIPSFIRGILRMLVSGKNTDIYRVKELETELGG